MKFIDLFAGVGGFHAALTNLGHECVFACEIEPELNLLYKKNWGIEAATDIRKVKPENIPDHDILCAGFPCQPFSKINRVRLGLKCPENGDLFSYIVMILMVKRPRFFILENVQKLKSHNGGKDFNEMKKALKEIGYNFDYNICSPVDYGIPQHRPRLFIIGDRDHQPFFMNKPKVKTPNLDSILENELVDGHYYFTDKQKALLDIWQEFWEKYCDNEDLPHEICAHEFQATYPYEDEHPGRMPINALRMYHGSYGISLQDMNDEKIKKAVPVYALGSKPTLPEYRIKTIAQNRCFYLLNTVWLNKWLPKLKGYARTHAQLTVNIRDNIKDIRKGIILMTRPSGITISKNNIYPTIVSGVGNDKGIGVGRLNRFLTLKESARLQSFPENLVLPDTHSKAGKAIVNSVNIKVVQGVAETLLNFAL